jgi:hypothetical protein
MRGRIRNAGYRPRVPPRRNLFQETIAVIYEHLAHAEGTATVGESATLEHRTTGEMREVDVAVRSDIAGHEILVCVEARASVRKADPPWVESIVGKHAELPPSQLVLVSEHWL